MSAGSEKNVYQRIHAVANDMQTVAKDGRNDFHKYDYATEASFVHALRPLLFKHGLVIVPSVASIPQFENGLTSITMKFTIVNIDKPDEKVDMLIPGQGQDKGDKGVYKALTGAKKYFIALAFMVATGDDPEKDEKGTTKATTVQNAAPTLTTVQTAGAATAPRTSFRKPAAVKTASVGDDI